MTREEILKIMVRELDDIKMRDYNPLWAAEWILGILSDCGLVIKVDRELPKISEIKHRNSIVNHSGNTGIRQYWAEIITSKQDAQKDMLKAGYVAVESLIE